MHFIIDPSNVLNFGFKISAEILDFKPNREDIHESNSEPKKADISGNFGYFGQNPTQTMSTEITKKPCAHVAYWVGSDVKLSLNRSCLKQTTAKKSHSLAKKP